MAVAMSHLSSWVGVPTRAARSEQFGLEAAKKVVALREAAERSSAGFWAVWMLYISSFKFATPSRLACQQSHGLLLLGC